MDNTIECATLVQLLRRRAINQPERIAYTFWPDGEKENATLTYGELDRRAQAGAALLQSLGATGERVLLLYPPGLDFIAAFFACLYSGAVAVPVYPPRRNRGISRITTVIADAQPTVALTTSQILSRTASLFSTFNELNSMRWRNFDEGTNEIQREWRELSITSEALCLFQYTSGSTSAPKGVMLSHRNLLHNSAMLSYSFEYSSESSCVSWLPVYHDMGLIGGVLQPLNGGFPGALMPPTSFLQRPLRWLEMISNCRATISGGPSFAYELCVRKISDEHLASLDLSSWSTAFNGAEPIRADILKRFAEKFEPCGFRKEAFFPCYGLAEATLIVSGGKTSSFPSIKHFKSADLEKHQAVESMSEDGRPLVGCGQVMPDIQAIIVNPNSLTKCSPGEVGEVWISGGGVAQGYWDHPDETRRAFQAFTSDVLEGPFLRTGDLGLLLKGELFITGRLKDLIIIRGLNHYPQDIERTVESSHQSLRLGGGAAFSLDVNGEERLVVVQEIDRDLSNSDDIINRIRIRVAEGHELQPFAVVLLKSGALPKTSSGKVQRGACRVAFIEGTLERVAEWRDKAHSGHEFVAALKPLDETHDAIEHWLVSQFAIRLGVDPSSIDINRSIDEYGLDSLLATELAHNIETNFGIVLPMAGILESPSINQIAAQAIETMGASSRAYNFSSFELKRSSEKHPLSHGQKALWYLNQLSPESSSYNIFGAACIEADLNSSALQKSFQGLIKRHACLRTTFSAQNGDPFQRLHEQMELSFHQEDASTWSDADLDDQLTKRAHLPFDLEEGPLFRVVVYTRSPQKHVILLAMHHIVSDFWSLAIMLSELGEFYTAERLGTTPALEPLALNYIDYVRWQSEMLISPDGDRLWSYWRTQLAGDLPALNLPTDRPRPPAPTSRGGTHHFKLGTQLTQDLKRVSGSHRATLFMTSLACFQALLYRYTGQEDLIIGALTAGRSSAQFAKLVGYFVNPLVMRADLSGLPSFADFLGRVRQYVLSSFDRQDYPFPLLVEKLQPERLAARPPIIQVMFILQGTYLLGGDELVSFVVGESGAKVQLGDLQLSPLLVKHQSTQFDLTIALAEANGGLSGSLHYNADLFDDISAIRITNHFQNLLKAIAVAQDQKITELPILTEAERHFLLAQGSGPWVDYPTESCIHRLYAARATANPDRTSVIFENEHLSYQELDRKANQLAHYLQKLGVGPQIMVGVYVERSLDLFVGLLAILKAGGAYIPLDPTYPRDRLEYVITDAGTPVIVSQQRLVQRLPQTGIKIVCLDTTVFHSEREDEPVSGVVSDNTAYVIYTSGSTGKPKGVMVSHKNVNNFFHGMDERVSCGENDSILALTSISFDISVLELFWTILRGAKVILLGEQALSAGSKVDTSLPIKKTIGFSLFYFASADSQNKEDRYRLLFEGAKFADTHGFEAVWTPERHFHSFGGLYPNPSVMSSALAAVTEHIKIRAGSVVLPLHHPIRIAEEWSLVDNISGGRVGIAFASGWHADDFVFFPNAYADRKERTYKGIELVRKLWRGESAKVLGGGGNEIEVKIYPTPVQAELPLWITAAGASETFIKAGELGANVLTHLLGQTIEDVANNIRLYRKSLAAHGYSAQSGRVTLMLHTYIDRSIQAVREKVYTPFTNYLKSSIGLISNLVASLNLPLDFNNISEEDMDSLLDFAFNRYFETGALFGTPETCEQMIERLKAIDVDEVACLIDFGVDVDSTLSGLRCLDELKEKTSFRESRASTQEDYSLPAQAARHNPTLMQCTPSLMKMLAVDENILKQLCSLRVLMLGGEALSPSLVSQLKPISPVAVMNMYGPTETTIWSSAGKVERSDRAVSIGRPIVNTQIYIVDGRLQPLPIKQTGELQIGGAGVASGYLNRPELTAMRFTPNPFSCDCGARLYQTGDLARYLEDGGIEFLGRIDQQIKLRGRRIELEEIEAVLDEHPEVKEAVVAAQEDAPGNLRLVAYLKMNPGASCDDDQLEAYLRQKLPDYMIPSSFVMLEKFPLTSNGKIDRKRLPAAQSGRGQFRSEHIPPKGAIEHQIAEIWRRTLNVDKVGRTDNFFDLGGNSLLLAQVHGQLRQVVDRNLPLVKMLEHPTISSLARFLSQEQVDQLSAQQQNLDRAEKLREGLSRQRRTAVKAREKSEHRG